MYSEVFKKKMIELVENCDLRHYVAVIPSVCVGNVGQLAADLLIFNLDLKRLGYIWHSKLLTFCGADPFGPSDNFTTACELYYSTKLKIIVFQIRSALRKNSRDILENIAIWLKEQQVSQVIILAGIAAHRRGDRQLVGKPLRYMFCPRTEMKELENAKSRNWLELENIGSVNESSNNIPPHLPGAGSALKWFRECFDKKLPCAVLFEFCSDGNNTPDALKLVEYLDEWLHLKEKLETDSWVMPTSWSFLFGLPPPTEIFN